MFRRRFLKAVAAVVGSLFLPKKAKAAETTETPFLPTLEWLREREPRITAIEVTYREGRYVRPGQREWKCFIFKEHSPDPDYSHAIVALKIVGGAWAVQQDTEKSGCPVDKSYKPEWPDWLRKF